MTDETADQDVSQSMSDRIAAKFGFGAMQPQAEDSEPQVDATPEPVDFEIDWEGEKFKVPVKLKDAFMKNQDYTQKTQALAARNKEIEHVNEMANQAMMERRFHETIAPEQQELAVIEAYLQQMGKADFSNMSVENMLKTRMELDTVKERREALKQSIENKRGQFTKEFGDRIAELRVKARELASKSITGFSEQAEKEMRDFAQSEGLSTKELDNVLLDPRSFKILWKASQYDKIKASTGKAVEATQKVVKPGAASERMPSDTAAKLNFHKAMKAAKTSGQKAQVIESRLEGLFGARR